MILYKGNTITGHTNFSETLLVIFLSWHHDKGIHLYLSNLVSHKQIPEDDYQQHFSDASFWQKTKQFAIKIGKETMEKSLIMYYCMKDADTPAKHKSIILSALGYFILPLDLIPDILPGGWMDDLGALALAFSTVTSSIKDSHVAMAQLKLDKFFKKSKDQEPQNDSLIE